MKGKRKTRKNYHLWGGDFKKFLDEDIASLRGLHNPDLLD